MDRGKEGKRSEGGGVVRSVPEMWIDGQIGDGNSPFWKRSADYHGRGEEQEQSQEITASADIVQHTYTFLCPFSSGFLFGIFISQGSPLLPTHTHTLSELQSLLNFLPQVKR